ncbi:hypothetical protein J5N97_018994 [Dioscorea zingiberensis]|uniref:Glycosyltransferase n=1 Tax=Dioscorea zingiberensis TaxID=325984 RepID=A0A9D5CF28_9LILI|nr:hypothetical protein J5N97_018994 [Dioscorea zingiberensis]
MEETTKALLPLRVFFFPLMAPGHMIPLIDIAKLFAARGISSTVVVTPGNEPFARPVINRANATLFATFTPIHLLLLPFPSSVLHHLPDGKENLSTFVFSHFTDFFKAVFALEQPFNDLLRTHLPDCLISDSMFPWTADAAINLGIPRLVFHGPGIFPLCVHDSLKLHDNFRDGNPFVIRDIPDTIEMRRHEVPMIFDALPLLKMVSESEEKSHGVITNSFYELEPAYAEHYRRKPGRRAWYVGPVSLCNEASEEKEERGRLKPHPEFAAWFAWLNSKPAGSVVYVCFGSLCELTSDQVKELALGLEASGHFFVWVVRGETAQPPEGFEERVRNVGVGLVIRGWAPQLVILGHVAVGGFVTHCGWNSTLEAITAGVPMVTWPLSSEQFVNEKFLTKVVRIGVGVRREGMDPTAVVGAEEVAMAVRRVMDGGDEASGRRRRVGEYAKLARAAMIKGGSSYMDLSRLIDELVTCRATAGGNAVG